MIAIRRLLAIFLLLASLPAAAMEFEQSSLTVETQSGGRYRFDVELAVTEAQHIRGLMFRQSMADDRGMLFIYGRPQEASFWMKNTYIPLDIVFVAENGRITNIEANATPQTLTPRNSATAVLGVLEIKGGLAAKLGIRPGDLIVHPAFKAAQR